MFDNTAIAAAELLSHFGKNTAVRIDHKYGTSKLCVIVARTNNEIAVVDINDDSYAVSNVRTKSLEEIARVIMGNKRFPKPRNMRRSWSPIRLTDDAKAEADISRATMNGYFSS